MIFNESCADLTPPRGAPGDPLVGPSPWPPAPVLLLLLHFLYLFSLSYLTANSIFFVDPHAGPRGRRIQRPAASAADPEEKSRTTWFAGVEVVVLKERIPRLRIA